LLVIPSEARNLLELIQKVICVAVKQTVDFSSQKPFHEMTPVAIPPTHVIPSEARNLLELIRMALCCIKTDFSSQKPLLEMTIMATCHSDAWVLGGGICWKSSV